MSRENVAGHREFKDGIARDQSYIAVLLVSRRQGRVEREMSTSRIAMTFMFGETFA